MLREIICSEKIIDNKYRKDLNWCLNKRTYKYFVPFEKIIYGVNKNAP